MSRVGPRAQMPAELPGAVVFDMDGLMLDSERVDRDIWRTLLGRRGYEFPDALHAALVGRRDADSEASLRAHYGESFPLAELRAEARAAWHAHLATDTVPHKDGLAELLGHLAAARLPVAIASSTGRARALAKLGPLAARFDALAFGDEVRAGKPAPDVFLLAAERLRVAPATCLALEDSPAGVAAAEAAGMTVIMIPDLVAPERPPRYHCSSLHEVVEWLRHPAGVGS
jgi:HAD superfamily hydrolase (TIGR01509 family)